MKLKVKTVNWVTLDKEYYFNYAILNIQRVSGFISILTNTNLCVYYPTSIKLEIKIATVLKMKTLIKIRYFVSQKNVNRSRFNTIQCF